MAGQAHPPRVDESAGHNSLRSIGGKNTVHSWNGGIITGRLHRGCENNSIPGRNHRLCSAHYKSCAEE